MLFRSILETPYGTMQLANRGRPFSAQAPSREAHAAARAAQLQLGEYFAGRRREFDLRFEPRTGSEFERNVWKLLCEIPYGKTTSYGAIAAEFGLVNGARAVGRANGANPIPIIIPCHRVIGSDGNLVGFGAIAPLPPRLF